MGALAASDDSSFEERAGPWIAFARVFVGLLLLYEAVVGGWWKLGTFSSGPNPEWLGGDAGVAIVDVAEQAIEEGTYGWYATILEVVIIPYAPTWAVLATVAQVAVGVALVIGLWTRPAALIGLLYFLPVFHFGTIRTSPLFAVPIVFAFVANAGRYYGLDARLWDRSCAVGRFTRLVNAPLPIPKRAYPPLAAAFAVVSLYYYLSVPTIEETRIALVGLELAVLAGLTALGLTLVWLGGRPTAVAADVLRIFVGYRFIHEIFVRTGLGANRLPGWASPAEQAEAFESIADAHVAPMSAFLEVAVLPAMSAWVVAFAIVQTAVGIALLVGYRTRLAGTIAVAYLLVLTAFGLVRLSPLLFTSTVVAAMLAGRYVSLDAVAGRDVAVPQVPTEVAIPAAVGAAVLFGTGVAIGIDPEAGYGAVAGPVSLVMGAFVLAAVAVAARAGEHLETSVTGTAQLADD